MGHDIGCLRTTRPRKVIWVSEDPDQVVRLLYAYTEFEGVPKQLILDMFILIDAKRVTAAELAKLSENVALSHHNGTPPWLIIDTASANMSIRDENDNAAVAEFVSAIKETIYIKQNTPVLTITHTAKALGRNDEDASARGASAWEGDATMTATLFMDGDERFLKLRKTRYEPMVREIRAETRRHTIAVVDDQGDLQDMVLTYTIPMESNQDERVQLRQQAINEEEQLR